MEWWERYPRADRRRPNWEEMEWTRRGGGYVICTGCRQALQTMEAVTDHWDRGHFDIRIKPERYPVGLSF